MNASAIGQNLDRTDTCTVGTKVNDPLVCEGAVKYVRVNRALTMVEE